MTKYKLNDLSAGRIKELCQRSSVDLDSVIEKVKPILNDIKTSGLKAALEYSRKFGEDPGNDYKVGEDEFNAAEKSIKPTLKSAINFAAENIRKFHSSQLPKAYEIETAQGVKCSRIFNAIESVGLYIPGGSAVLFSTMLMLGIPAQLAGCKRVTVCSPSKNGTVDPALLYSAKICGIKEFYKIGGAQAVALMAYGDSDIPKSYKIFGPGNQYVTAAKLLVSIDAKGCALDMPAGPSEVLIIADEFCDPKFVAADLLSQAEHGADSQSILLTNSDAVADKVAGELNKQLGGLPRKELVEQSLNNSYTIVTDDLAKAFEFSNEYAPEHLILNLKDARKYKSMIVNAGSVFIGAYSPESAGDYASGTNHTLPTSGYSKMYGGVGVESFMKSITYQELTKQGLENISETVISMADAESLSAHSNAVKVRLNNGN